MMTKDESEACYLNVRKMIQQINTSSCSCLAVAGHDGNRGGAFLAQSVASSAMIVLLLPLFPKQNLDPTYNLWLFITRLEG